MFYPKNVPNLERAIRIVLGIGLIAFVTFSQSTFSPLLTGVAICSGLFIIVTGFIGWCPACALVGRRLKSQHEKHS
jgi:hypothetical protein